MAILGLERELFSKESCLTVAQSLGEDAEIVPFAEELLREKACKDFDELQDLVELAYHRSLTEDPPENIFQVEPMEPTGKKAETAQAGVEFPDSMPDFKQLDELKDDSAADEFMRQLLGAAQEMGCSDLHISAGARPFVRLNGAIRYLHEANLPEAAAHSLNTALLDDGQRERFEVGEAL